MFRNQVLINGLCNKMVSNRTWYIIQNLTIKLFHGFPLDRFQRRVHPESICQVQWEMVRWKTIELRILSCAEMATSNMW